MSKTRAEKAENLIKYFEGKALPACPFKINQCTTVVDVNRIIEINSIQLRHYNPASPLFVDAYLRLYELKKFIENGNKF